MRSTNHTSSFLSELEDIVKNATPALYLETIPVGEASFVTIVKNKALNDLAMVIEHDQVCILVGWNKGDLRCDCVLYEDYIEARFREFENDDWHKRALDYIKIHLKKQIFLFISYLRKQPIKVRYAVKLDNGLYKTIFSKKLCRLKLWDLFQSKEERMFEVVFTENSFPSLFL